MAQAGPGNNAKVIWLDNLRGLNDSLSLGELNQQAILTNNLSNVKVRFGELEGRGGLLNYKGAIATLDGPILSLIFYNRGLQTTNQLLRLLPTKLEVLIGSTWTDVTGNAIGGLPTSRPQYTTQHGVIVYTMEGLARPQGWGVNPGAAVNYLTSTQLGGNPPFGKSIVSYMQFVLLGNVSNDGTFVDVLDGWRTIIYSDDPFFSWFDCIGNSINVYQTPGKIMAMKVIGRDLMIYKDDGVVRLTWVGTAVRFTQDLIPGSVGTIAPLSVADLGAFGHAYLGTDGYIYHNTGAQIRPVSPGFLETTLPPLLQLQRFRFARAMVLPTQDLYLLFYDRSGLTGQFLDAYVAWNYRTGEFVKGELGLPVIAAQMFRPEEDSREVGLVGSNDKVYEFDSPIIQTDDGKVVKRVWTTGWQNFAGAEGFIFGAIADMDPDPKATLKISVARNLQDKYENSQDFSLADVYHSRNPEARGVECNYRFPSPIRGGWFNFKLELFHNSATSKTKLHRFGVIARPSAQYPVTQQQLPQDQMSRGN